MKSENQAIDLHARGTPVTEICSRLQIGRSTLYLWLQQADPNHPKTIPRNEYKEGSFPEVFLHH